eukprot:196181_1
MATCMRLRHSGSVFANAFRRRAMTTSTFGSSSLIPVNARTSLLRNTRSFASNTAVRSATQDSVEEEEEEYEDDDDRDYDDYSGESDGDDEPLRVGALAPEFSCKAAYDGKITEIDSDMFKGQWMVLFFYPLDFTFVCPTEIIEFSNQAEKFSEINCQVMGCSVDSVYSHLAWSKMSRKDGGLGENLKIPLLADLDRHMAESFGAMNLEGTHTLRATYIMDPEGIVRHATVGDAPVGRNVDEIVRLVKAHQFHAEHGEVCPVNWTPGKDTIKPNPKDSKDFFKKQ